MAPGNSMRINQRDPAARRLDTSCRRRGHHLRTRVVSCDPPARAPAFPRKPAPPHESQLPTLAIVRSIRGGARMARRDLSCTARNRQLRSTAPVRSRKFFRGQRAGNNFLHDDRTAHRAAGNRPF